MYWECLFSGNSDLNSRILYNAMSDIAIELQQVCKTYRLYERNVVDRFKDTFIPGGKKRHRDFYALTDISLTVKKGEILGIVGRNGAGKSTLLKIISGITRPTTGNVRVNGRVVPLLELGGGFNPEYTGRENIYFYCALQGMKKEEIDGIYDTIVEFSELDEFIDVPIKRYSSGMKARLGFAVSVNIDPDILILDEVLAVGDELFRRKCFMKMEEFFQSGKTILYVTHSVQSVIEICTSAIMLHKGEKIIQGSPRVVVPSFRQFMNNNSDSDMEIERLRKLDRNAVMKYKMENDPEWESLDNNLDANQKTQNSELENRSYYVDDFVSKVKKEIYKRDIQLGDCYIFDEYNRKVNHLIADREYTFYANVFFREPIQHVRVRLSIYSARSKELAVLILPNQISESLEIREKSELSIKTKFISILPEGVYGVMITITGESNGSLQRIANVKDALLFRSIVSSEGVQNDGIVRLFKDTQFQLTVSDAGE